MSRTFKHGDWPVPLRKLSKKQLQRLDDPTFGRLKSQLVDRGRKRSGSNAFAKSIGRKVELRRRSDKRVEFSKELLLARRRDSALLDAFVTNRASRWEENMARRRKRWHITASNFSFIDDPIAAMEALSQIAQSECDGAEVQLDFLDPHVLDIGPFLVLGLMYERMAPVIRGGLVTNATMKVLDAVGLRKFLRMHRFRIAHPLRDVWALPLARLRAGGTSSSENIALEPSRVEITADQIVRHVDHWLREIEPPYALTRWGSSQIKAFVSEILDNAERHGRLGGDGEWISAGFMARRPMAVGSGERETHVCHLAFFNPGTPIAETIRLAPPDIQRQVDAYVRRHRLSGAHHDTLATIFALQDGISRFAQGGGAPSGGTGLMDIVDFANEVGRTDTEEFSAKVAIVSGNAYIRFAAPYRRGIRAGADEPREQWFNPENSVMDPPSNTNAITMPKKFPGTLIALRFVLDGSFQAREKS